MPFDSWVRKSPGGRHGNPLSFLACRIPRDRGVWGATVHRVTKRRTWLKWLCTHTCIIFKTLIILDSNLETILNRKIRNIIYLMVASSQNNVSFKWYCFLIHSPAFEHCWCKNKLSSARSFFVHFNIKECVSDTCCGHFILFSEKT